MTSRRPPGRLSSQDVGRSGATASSGYVQERERVLALRSTVRCSTVRSIFSAEVVAAWRVRFFPSVQGARSEAVREPAPVAHTPAAGDGALRLCG